MKFLNKIFKIKKSEILKNCLVTHIKQQSDHLGFPVQRGFVQRRARLCRFVDVDPGFEQQPESNTLA